MRLLLALLLLAVPAPDYTEAFHRTSGWTGADAAYSLPLGDGRTLWVFGDTFFGEVLPDGRRSPDSAFVNNSAALQQGLDPATLRFFPGPLFVPPDGPGFFWPLDGTSPGPGRATVFLGRFEATGEAGAFGFQATGSWLAEVAADPEPRVASYRRLPFFAAQPATMFGAAVMEDGPWTYVYGVRDEGTRKGLLAARVPRGRLAEPGLWRFRTAGGWGPDFRQAVALAENVSNELSVHRAGEGYVLVSGPAGLSGEVLVRTAGSPVGPWSEPAVAWTPPEAGGGVFAYNAKAHPELSDERGLLVSYNVNALDPARVMRDAGIYRPRFVRLPAGSLPAPAKPGAP